MSESSEAPQVDKRALAEEVLGAILQRMGYRARVEVKHTEERPAQDDQPAIPAALSAAVFPEGELPGLSTGKRTPLVEALQFLANKVVNRGGDKRWIHVGVGEHPEPRAPGQPRQPKHSQAPQAASAPSAPKGAEAPPRQKKPERERKERPVPPPREQRAREPEAQLEVTLDPDLARLGHSLAQKAAELGRTYAVLGMSPDDRARLVRAATSVEGVSVRSEGEGRHRRVAFIPANPNPMPKKAVMPDYDDEDELEE